MNRRSFLKAIGLAIAAPGAVLGAVKATPTIPAVSGGGLTAAMIQEVVRKRLRDSPAAYYIFIHPNDPDREKLLAHGPEPGVIKCVEHKKIRIF